MPARGGKGTTWTPELERHMLILAITAADLKPSAATWNLVAQAMGNGITGSAVSQKFFKLKKAIESESGVTPTTSSSATAASPAAPKQQTKKNTPAATGRKRKAAGTTKDASKPPQKKAGHVKKESEDDEEQVEEPETDDTAENEDQVDGKMVGEEAGEEVSGNQA